MCAPNFVAKSLPLVARTPDQLDHPGCSLIGNTGCLPGRGRGRRGGGQVPEAI
jgi:hypothetical protein